MRTGISRRWAACISAAVVLGVSGLGVWSANADTGPAETDTTWGVTDSAGQGSGVDGLAQKVSLRLRSFNDTTWG